MALTQDTLKSLVSYDSNTGIFIWRNPASRRIRVGSQAGTVTRFGYVRIGISGKYYSGHRLAWLYFFGEMPCGHIDHINGDKRDNRIANLREVTLSANMQNQRRAHRNSTTGLLGASLDKSSGKFVAQINIGGTVKKLGRFTTAEEAHAAYISAKRHHHQGCTI